MIDELLKAIKRFAKRQMTWFRRDRDIVWIDMTGAVSYTHLGARP